MPLVDALVYCMKRNVTTPPVLTAVLFTCDLCADILEFRGVKSSSRYTQSEEQREFGKRGGVNALARCLHKCCEDACAEQIRAMDTQSTCVSQDRQTERPSKIWRSQGLPAAALRLLACAVRGSPEIQHLCTEEEGLVGVVRDLMAGHRDDGDVQAYATEVVKVLCESSAAATTAATTRKKQDKDASADQSHACDERDVTDAFERVRLSSQKDALKILGSKTRDVCLSCGRTAADVGKDKLHICSACTIRAMYCCVECQRAHWHVHRVECRVNRK
jgi:hypothetical protein